MPLQLQKYNCFISAYRTFCRRLMNQPNNLHYKEYVKGLDKYIYGWMNDNCSSGRGFDSLISPAGGASLRLVLFKFIQFSRTRGAPQWLKIIYCAFTYLGNCLVCKRSISHLLLRYWFGFRLNKYSALAATCYQVKKPILLLFCPSVNSARLNYWTILYDYF